MSLRPLLMIPSSPWIGGVNAEAHYEQSDLDVSASAEKNVVLGSPCFLGSISEQVAEKMQNAAGRVGFENLCQGFLGFVLVHLSILLRQQKRGHLTPPVVANSLGDDPQFLALRRPIDGQEPLAGDECIVVGLPVIVADLAPIARDMAKDEWGGRLSSLLNCVESTRRG